MQRNTKRTITMIMVLISVLLLVSPIVFAKVGWRIDDVGLKSVQIRASILEDPGPGAKHGRISASIREIEPEVYSYKFVIDLKKATPFTEYSILAWAELPNIKFDIYGDGGSNWIAIEMLAGYIGIDLAPEDDSKIETSLGLLGLDGFQEFDTNLKFTTDYRGFFKSVKSGIISENNAIEYALDFGWPTLKQYIIAEYPELAPFLPDEIDFADFGIIGVTMYGGYFTVSGGVRFIGPGGLEGDDNYRSEDIVIDRFWKDFVWTA